MKRVTRWSIILVPAVLALFTLRAPGWAFGPVWLAEAEDDREVTAYEEGTDALDESEWEDAVEAFDEVARLGRSRVDGALYWKAYALSKLGRRQEALSELERLKSAHPKSRWINDAKALEVELRQKAGKGVPPQADDDEELKLVALNGLMQMDDERAVPMLERFLSGSGSRRLKEQALFVLVQTGSPRAREIVYRTARGQTYPALQRKAVEYLGIFGGREAERELAEIYRATGDDQVKRQVLQAYMVSGNSEALLAAAQSEPSPSLRREAIQLLGAHGAEEELAQLYQRETDVQVRENILQALAVSGSDRLIEAARREKDPRLRLKAVQSLGIMGSERAGQAVIEIYDAESSTDIKRAALGALMVQGNARGLIAIARREKNPELRRAAVEQLSVMGSKEATDFLMELLEE
ncbi:MAG TPA: HEAT repeat domain-containing protein [Candidatus Polarisedimenticolia bacterium]|nr:HEAT repeat domain-containing protein [Candidatus Polarisedimenticolia bacterium]